MYAKKKNRAWLLILVAIVAASALTGAAYAKYKKTLTYSGTLTFNAELGSLDLGERVAKRNADGSYTLSGNPVLASTLEPNSGPVNTYQLIPGLDIPKDPHVVITNKTAIEAYLYVEVVDGTQNEAIAWAMSKEWKLLDDVEGKGGNGAVYVYVDEGGNPKPLGKTEGDMTVYLLDGNKIEVKQGLLAGENNNALTFYAAMGETALGTTPAEVYKAIFQNAP